MATISRNKGNKRVKIMVSEQELKTLTIALALISVQDMETEMEEQGLTKEDVDYNHLGLFETFTKITKLYPKVEREKETKFVQGNSEVIINEESISISADKIKITSEVISQ